MDLRPIVLYLSRKRLSAKDVHLGIVHALGPDAVGYSTAMPHLYDALGAGRMDPEAAPDHDQKPHYIDSATVAALSELVRTAVRSSPGVVVVDPRFEISGALTSEAIAALSHAASSLGVPLSDTRSEGREA
jgi:hypothetical protein